MCYLCNEPTFGWPEERIVIEGVVVRVHSKCAIEYYRQLKRLAVCRRARAWKRVLRFLKAAWSI